MTGDRWHPAILTGKIFHSWIAIQSAVRACYEIYDRHPILTLLGLEREKLTINIDDYRVGHCVIGE